MTRSRRYIVSVHVLQVYEFMSVHNHISEIIYCVAYLHDVSGLSNFNQVHEVEGQEVG